MVAQNKFQQAVSWAEGNQSSRMFRFAGATQRGRSWAHENNQDAYAISVDANSFVGVVADGCSSAPSGYQSHSEVGAKLLSRLLCKYVAEQVRKTSVLAFSKRILNHEKAIKRKILRLVSVICEDGDLECLVRTFFASTLLCLIIDETDYLVFGCGDGLIIIDDIAFDLGGESGLYYAIDCLGSADHRSAEPTGLKIHKAGKTTEINGVFLATDGFEDIHRSCPGVLEQFVSDLPNLHPSIPETGYSNDLIRSFRRQVMKQKGVASWLETQDSHDDRTFIVLERILPREIAQPVDDHANEIPPKATFAQVNDDPLLHDACADNEHVERTQDSNYSMSVSEGKPTIDVGQNSQRIIEDFIASQDDETERPRNDFPAERQKRSRSTGPNAVKIRSNGGME